MSPAGVEDVPHVRASVLRRALAAPLAARSVAARFPRLVQRQRATEDGAEGGMIVYRIYQPSLVQLMIAACDPADPIHFLTVITDNPVGADGSAQIIQETMKFCPCAQCGGWDEV